MALFGPRITGDADITGIVSTIRSQSTLTTKTANFTIGTKEAEIFNITSGTLTVTAPAANNTDLKAGAQFLIINDSTGAATVAANTSGNIGTVPAGESALLILKTTATANGTWELILLDQDMTGVTKFSATFDATTDWGTATGGAFSMTIDASAIVSANPIISVFRSSDNALVLVDVTASATSNIILSVPVIGDGNDARFAGTIVVI